MRYEALLKPTLFANGIADLLCAAALLILPRLNTPLLGYAVFDVQGAFMAGGWGVSTLALGVTRIYASTRPECHAAMLLLGIVEGLCLAAFCLAYLLQVKVPIAPVLLPLVVGGVFGASYVICAADLRGFQKPRRSRDHTASEG